MEDKLITISTIGDSLTDGSPMRPTIGKEFFFPFQYQSYTYKYLKEKGCNVGIQNYGVGGQIFAETTHRFEETLPADIIVNMIGTNDLWRHSDMVDGIEEEIGEEYISLHNMALKKTKGQCKHIIMCSIPPFGKVMFLPKRVQITVKYMNELIEQYVKDLNSKKIDLGLDDTTFYFCDVHKGMRNSDDFYMDPKNCRDDGVHFTRAGNRACGKTIAKTIYELIK